MRGFVRCLACVIFPIAAYASEPVFDAEGFLRSLNSSAPAVAQPAAAQYLISQNSAPKEWTVLLFFNGKNNLEEYALTDFNEIETVGSSRQVNIVAELGRMKGHSAADGNWTGSRRYLVVKDTDTARINSPVLQSIPQSDMGAWQHLVDFVAWGKKTFPAKKYMLVIWNHGSGWKPFDPEMFASSRWISYDEETSHHIATWEMGQMFAKIGQLDVYASDACLMQMVEVAYEIKNYIPIIVGSEEVEPSDGFAYNAFFKLLKSNPSADPATAGKYVVDSYKAYFSPPNKGVTMSAVRASALPALAQAASGLAQALMQNEGPQKVKEAAKKTRSFYDEDYKDLYHFAQLLSVSAQSPAVKTKAAEVMSAVTRAVVANGTVNAAYSNAKGISIYLPLKKYDIAYANLAFARDTAWDDLLVWLAPKRK